MEFCCYQISLSFGVKVLLLCLKIGVQYIDFSVYSKRLKSATIENLSYKQLIEQYYSLYTLFYFDPPYVNTENYYKITNGFTMIDRLNLAQILKSIKAKFMLSYNDCKIVRDLYTDLNVKEL